MPIKIDGGKFTNVNGDYRVIDRSVHENNIDSGNMYRNRVTDSWNSANSIGQNPRSSSADEEGMGRTPSSTADNRRPEDYIGPPPQFFHQQNCSAGGHIVNRDAFNLKDNRISNSFNDNSETHYFGRVPPGPQQHGVGLQNTRSNSESFGNAQMNGSEQTSQMTQGIENHIQHMSWRMRQTFAEAPAQTPQGVSNMPGNNDESRDYPHHSRPNPSFGNNDSNTPPPAASSSRGPIFRTINGNLIKYDNSVHQTNISSFNAEDNEVINSFNEVDSSGNWQNGPTN